MTPEVGDAPIIAALISVRCFVTQHDAKAGGASLSTKTFMGSQLVILRYEGSSALSKIVEF